MVARCCAGTTYQRTKRKCAVSRAESCLKSFSNHFGHPGDSLESVTPESRIKCPLFFAPLVNKFEFRRLRVAPTLNESSTQKLERFFIGNIVLFVRFRLPCTDEVFT